MDSVTWKRRTQDLGSCPSGACLHFVSTTQCPKISSCNTYGVLKSSSLLFCEDQFISNYSAVKYSCVKEDKRREGNDKSTRRGKEGEGRECIARFYGRNGS